MIPYSGYKEFLRACLETTTPSAYVFLVKADFLETALDITWAGITEADYAGYAQQAYWDGLASPDLDSNPWGRIVSPTFTFNPTGILAPQTLYGIGVVKTVGGVKTIVALNRFDAPVTFSADTDKIQRGIDFFSRSFTP